jgi:hypothetical protein
MRAARGHLRLVQGIHTRFPFRRGARTDRPSRLVWLLRFVLLIGALLVSGIKYPRVAPTHAIPHSP